MKLEPQIEKKTLILVVKESIKSIEDSMQFQLTIDNLTMQNEINNIEIIIEEAYTITSSIIGYLLRLIKQDSMSVSILCRHKELVELLEKLNLATLFNVKVM